MLDLNLQKVKLNNIALERYQLEAQILQSGDQTQTDQIRIIRLMKREEDLQAELVYQRGLARLEGIYFKGPLYFLFNRKKINEAKIKIVTSNLSNLRVELANLKKNEKTKLERSGGIAAQEAEIKKLEAVVAAAKDGKGLGKINLRAEILRGEEFRKRLADEFIGMLFAIGRVNENGEIKGKEGLIVSEAVNRLASVEHRGVETIFKLNDGREISILPETILLENGLALIIPRGTESLIDGLILRDAKNEEWMVVLDAQNEPQVKKIKSEIINPRTGMPFNESAPVAKIINPRTDNPLNESAPVAKIINPRTDRPFNESAPAVKLLGPDGRPFVPVAKIINPRTGRPFSESAPAVKLLGPDGKPLNESAPAVKLLGPDGKPLNESALAAKIINPRTGMPFNELAPAVKLLGPDGMPFNESAPVAKIINPRTDRPLNESAPVAQIITPRNDRPLNESAPVAKIINPRTDRPFSESAPAVKLLGPDGRPSVSVVPAVVATPVPAAPVSPALVEELAASTAPDEEPNELSDKTEKLVKEKTVEAAKEWLEFFEQESGEFVLFGSQDITSAASRRPGPGHARSSRAIPGKTILREKNKSPYYIITTSLGWNGRVLSANVIKVSKSLRGSVEYEVVKGKVFKKGSFEIYNYDASKTEQSLPLAEPVAPIAPVTESTVPVAETASAQPTAAPVAVDDGNDVVAELAQGLLEAKTAQQ